MRKFFLFYTLMFLSLFIGDTANATSYNWQKLPIACLPERAQPWVKGTPEAQQQACHCPPVELCPRTYEEYSDNSKANMPVSFVHRCCPTVPAPERCPDGSLKVEGQSCPETITAECPVKFYPNIEMQGITSGTKYTTKYIDDSGKQHNFTDIVKDKSQLMEVDRLSTLFDWSLRLSIFSYWIHGDQFCKGALLSNGLTICASPAYTALGNPYTNTKTFDAIIKLLKPTDVTWFGISVAAINKLPNNLAEKEFLKKYSDSKLSFIQIAQNGYNEQAQRYQHKEVENPNIGLSSSNNAFVKACRSVAGEYATVEYHKQIVDGQTISCPYLQCRYVYDSTMESCLEENTEITLADGAKKKIADLKAGDLILNGEGKSSKVKAVNKYQEELRVLYGINGGKPTFTGDHPIKTKAGWKVVTEDATKLMAKQDGFADKPLAVGDVIVGLGGKEIEVKSIERHANFEPINTYNLKIEGDNSFVASDMVVKGFDKMEMHY